MSGKKIIALVLIISGLTLVCGFGILSFLRARRPTAGLKVESTPPSLVFVDNVQIGRTPLEKIFKDSDVTVKLIPDSTSSAISPYQTKVHLTSQTFTVIRRDFADSDSASAGETVSLQKNTGPTASLSIVTSNPDSASIVLDGQPQGFAPLLIPSVSPGDHHISLSSPGFVTRDILAIAVSGYKLTVSAKLSGSLPIVMDSSPSATSTGSPTPTPSGSKVITIKDTPTGFLRVRSGPGKNYPEVGQVKPGSSFPLLDTKTDWYLIKADLEATSSGWISSQYAKKKE